MKLKVACETYSLTLISSSFWKSESSSLSLEDGTSNWRRCVFPVGVCLLPPTHFKSSRRQLVQGIPSCVALQRTFLARAVLACFRGYLPGSASSIVQFRCWNRPSSCRRWSTRHGCCTGSIMFNHETASASASPTRREPSTQVKIFFRQQRWRCRDREQVRRRIKPLVLKEQM
jgi:hypothetical protein